jgi:hypothetical protein
VICDYDVRVAIESLQNSTALIEKHTQMLELQRDALQKLKQEEDGRGFQIAGLPNGSQQYERDSSRLNFEVRVHQTTLASMF